MEVSVGSGAPTIRHISRGTVGSRGKLLVSFIDPLRTPERGKFGAPPSSLPRIPVTIRSINNAEREQECENLSFLLPRSGPFARPLR